MAQVTLTTLGLWHVSRNLFWEGASQISAGDPNGMPNVAIGLARLNEALLATLTQMSADIAELKAEVEFLKAKPMFGPQAGLNFKR